jgi:hypothetical protein
MSKRFNDYTDTELLGITNETLNDAIRIEAIQRGINPPITIPEAIRKSEWMGYQKPAEAIRVFAIKSGYHTSTFAYLDETLAQRALEGLVAIEDSSYPTPHTKIKGDIPEVCIKWVGVEKSKEKAVKFEEYVDEKEKEFNTLRDECIQRFSRVRQDDYNAKVLQEKRKEYLRLAGGNEEIARGFWAKVEQSTWPE